MGYHNKVRGEDTGFVSLTTCTPSGETSSLDSTRVPFVWMDQSPTSLNACTHATFFLKRDKLFVCPKSLTQSPFAMASAVRACLVSPTVLPVHPSDASSELLVAARSLQQNGVLRAHPTGDLARVGPRGRLELLGRVGSQVKLNGQRVNLHEVEGVLQAHPRVRAAAAHLSQHPVSDIAHSFKSARCLLVELRSNIPVHEFAFPEAAEFL